MPDNPIQTAVQFAFETVIPGGSNLVKGDLAQGVIHGVLGIAGRWFFGVPGLVAVHTNSFVKATTGKHIHELLGLTMAGPATTSGAIAA